MRCILIITTLCTATLGIDTRALGRTDSDRSSLFSPSTNTPPSQSNDNVTLGALESSMDILLRFQSEITKEQNADQIDEQRRISDCNNTMFKYLQQIATVKEAVGELLPSEDYKKVSDSLNLAIKNIRSHYVNATDWVKHVKVAYAHTTKELELANNKLQDMNIRHDSVTNTLKDLVKSVDNHKNKKIKGTAPGETDRISSLIQLTSNLMNNIKYKSVRNDNKPRMKQYINSLLEISIANINGGWHDEVTRLSNSISRAVQESKIVRAKPIELKVEELKKQVAVDVTALKNALDAQSKTSEALLTAKHSMGIIEARSKESDVRRLQYSRATKEATLKLNQINNKCDQEYSEFKSINDANSDSLSTINEFLSVLMDEKNTQEKKLEEAVAILN
jgi:hypothetical protein